jgi:hypothetical protein
MSRFPLLLAIAALGALASMPCAAQAPVNDVERLVLIDGKTIDGWQTTESSLSAIVLDGVDAFRFALVIDWKTGEPNYPIGWPRISQEIRSGDWRKWEQLHLRVLARTDAGAFPEEPLGVTISSEGRNAGWEKEAQPLQAGRWQDFTFDLRDLGNAGEVRSIGVFVSDASYADGTELEFYIGRLELLRHKQPTLMAFRPLARVAFADARAVSLTVRMLGVAAGATAPVKIALMGEEGVIASHTAQAAEGETQVSLPLPEPLSPGEYALTVSVGTRGLSERVRLIASPWQEAAR